MSDSSLQNPKRRKGMAWAASSLLLLSSRGTLAKDLSLLSSEGVELVFPRLADTGNAIPLQVKITAPNSLYLTSLKVILPENPNPLAVELRLTGKHTTYLFNTRLRLAASQSVWVLASMSNGTERANSAPTVITSTACFDDS
jgi:sulfur-oxidizing protein SoxY